jgi:hypothetical protein
MRRELKKAQEMRASGSNENVEAQIDSSSTLKRWNGGQLVVVHVAFVFYVGLGG